MSEYHVVNVEFKEEDCLLEALKKAGYYPRVYENGTTISNSFSKSTPKAHIVVNRSQFNGCADLGFERIKDGFKMHVDHYDYLEGGVDKIKMNLIKQYNAESAIKKAVRSNSKYSVFSREEKGGKINIKLRRVGSVSDRRNNG